MKTINASLYAAEGLEFLNSPSLIYYQDLIVQNIQKTISIAGSPEKLWPHIKTHKMLEMVILLISAGITRFKCATLTELELACAAGAKNALLAYPIVGPNISRFISLQKNYPQVQLWALGDDYESLLLLSREAQRTGIRIPLLIDVNVGMKRTGVQAGMPAVTLFKKAYSLPGLETKGLHCYDGHIHDPELKVREEKAAAVYGLILDMVSQLEKEHIPVSVIIAGGTPTFPCFAKIKNKDLYCSPGTLFINDYGYYTCYEDLDMIPAAVILSRVVSNPGEDLFTLDAGYKAVSADPAGVRGIIADFQKAVPVSQNEEHWVFKKDSSMELPKPGTLVKVIPTHICPTTALYPHAYLVKDGKVRGKWDVTARNRE